MQPALLLTEQEAASLGGLLIAAAGASPSIRTSFDHGYTPVSAMQEYDSAPGHDEGVHESIAIEEDASMERMVNIALHTASNEVA
ncbi:MAG: hypothetical protein DI537_10240 [Stutzerimonas stutzeri]|nr:MAG: hypothetical protein DI537_10240 [Stutzerimonas stutzeri]